jgi:hypothetical protein
MFDVYFDALSSAVVLKTPDARVTYNAEIGPCEALRMVLQLSQSHCVDVHHFKLRDYANAFMLRHWNWRNDRQVNGEGIMAVYPMLLEDYEMAKPVGWSGKTNARFFQMPSLHHIHFAALGPVVFLSMASEKFVIAASCGETLVFLYFDHRDGELNTRNLCALFRKTILCSEMTAPLSEFLTGLSKDAIVVFQSNQYICQQVKEFYSDVLDIKHRSMKEIMCLYLNIVKDEPIAPLLCYGLSSSDPIADFIWTFLMYLRYTKEVAPLLMPYETMTEDKDALERVRISLGKLNFLTPTQEKIKGDFNTFIIKQFIALK